MLVVELLDQIGFRYGVAHGEALCGQAILVKVRVKGWTHATGVLQMEEVQTTIRGLSKMVTAASML